VDELKNLRLDDSSYQ